MKRFPPNRIPAACLTVLTTLLPLATCGAELSVPAIFSDGMVLQQKVRVPVWGSAEAGARVEVAFQEQRREVRADAEGRWKIHLDPLSASATPATLEIRDEECTLIIQNVLVGEVWLCGGQSNMDFALERFQGKSHDPQYQPLADYIRKEIATANDPLFRQFKVERKGAPFVEQRMTDGSWVLAISGQVDQFSATGYFFGRELRRELDVPVALLSCSWGGTFVESWMPMAAFQQKDSFRRYYDMQMAKLKKQMDLWDADAAKAENDTAMAQWNADVAKARAERTRPPRRPTLKEDPGLSRHIPGSLYNGMMHSLVPYAVNGVIWYQGESNARPGMSEEYGARFAAMITAWRERWSRPDLPFYWCQLAGFGEPHPEPVETDYWVDQVGSGLMVGKKHLMDPAVEVDEPLKQFQICGADQQWKWAEAKITGRDTVDVWHPEIPEPVEVRYAWAQNPEGANLYNREGLPASVFSTGSELEPRGPTNP